MDYWLRDPDDPADLATVSPSAAEWGAGNLLRWLREHNRASGYPVEFAGIDVPAGGGALRPALEPVGDYLRDVDPDTLPMLETALDISDRFLAGSGAAAAPAWARLEPSEQDTLTATLARLLLRMRAMEPHYVARAGRCRFDIAVHQVEAACHADYIFQASSGVFSGQHRIGDLSVREVYMAESLRWHVRRSGPRRRIVLAAHNNHIQKTSLWFDGVGTVFPMGQYLARMLGMTTVPSRWLIPRTRCQKCIRPTRPTLALPSRTLRCHQPNQAASRPRWRMLGSASGSA